jgi:endonuclease/exonuclease/phosphatase family metal-dependent hydrolase
MILTLAGCNPGTLRVREPPALRGETPERPDSQSTRDITVVNLNVTHGFRCDDPMAPAATANQCRLSDRLDLLLDWIEARGCPDIVTLQEIIDRTAAFFKPGEQLIIGPIESSRRLIQARMRAFAERCGFRYKALFDPAQRMDEELILSRYRIIARERIDLHSVLGVPLGIFDRHVLYARIEHPLGPVDVFTTHLSSGFDQANAPCDVNVKPFLKIRLIKKACPTECVEAGATTIRQCQAVQLANLVEELHDVPTPAIVTGDFNAEPGSFEYDLFIKRGFVDVHLAAGNPECNSETGVGCTSGRPEKLDALESPTSITNRRIEFIFVAPPASGSVCANRIDSPFDDDGDKTATRLFTDTPNPFATCGGPDKPICWVSDHNGVELDLNCPF